MTFPAAHLASVTYQVVNHTPIHSNPAMGRLHQRGAARLGEPTAPALKPTVRCMKRIHDPLMPPARKEPLVVQRNEVSGESAVRSRERRCALQEYQTI
jgi:hypothetical protein